MKRGVIRRLRTRLRLQSDRLYRAYSQRWHMRRWRLGAALLLCAASGLVVTCRLLDSGEPPLVRGEIPEVRVLLQSNANHVEVRVDGEYALLGEAERPLARGAALRPGLLVGKGRGIALNGHDEWEQQVWPALVHRILVNESASCICLCSLGHHGSWGTRRFLVTPK